MPTKENNLESKIWAMGVTCNFPIEDIAQAFELIDKCIFPNFSTLIRSGVRDFLETKYYIPLIERRSQIDEFQRKEEKTHTIQLENGEVIELST